MAKSSANISRSKKDFLPFHSVGTRVDMLSLKVVGRSKTGGSVFV